MSLIAPQDWKALSDKFLKAEPFPSICIDNFLDDEFARKLAKSYPDFTSAQEKGLEFSTVNEKRKVQITEPKDFPVEVEQLHQALADKDFINNIRTMSGIDDLIFDPKFSGGGMHITGSSGILDVHVDFNYSEELDRYRRLNILIYLNDDWDESWGGNVELWDKDVKHCVQNFSPILNRCVMFATSDISFHGVRATKTPDNIARKSFAIYLYSKFPADSQNRHSHSTIFKARPEEKLKKYISMPMESSTQALKNQGARVSRLINKLTKNPNDK